MNKITPIILSGGSGTRLWPISRQLNPKQFTNFFEKESLFEKTALRTKDKKLFNDPIIICNSEHRFKAAESLQNIKITPKSIILEPIAKNTAPAIAIGAIDIISKESSKDDLMLVMPSDHIIENEKEFIKQVKLASKAALDGYLVTFGIKASRAETGFGYIKKAKQLKNIKNIFEIAQFVEKPNLKKAKEYIASQDYLWNSGIFLFKASAYLQELKHFNNDLFINCCNSYNQSSKDLDFIRLDEEPFAKCQDISIDYCVMEKSKRTATISLDANWSDVGSWNALSDISDKNEDNNSLIGDVIALDSKDCYINSKDKLTTAIGVKNLIIITLKDAVLVANKNNSQDVKKLFNILKEQKREECVSHTTTYRPWGNFETIYISNRCKIKKIIVKPKACLSLQMHNHRAEHWVVIKGTANVTCDEKEFILKEDQSTYIPLGVKHRLENKGKIPLELVEVQTGSYLGEDDIVRFSDIYGR